MDLSPLAQSLHCYFQAGLAPATQKAYQAAMKRFATFCTTFSIHNPFPLTELLLSYYAAHLADQGLAPQTIKSYLAALRNAQIGMGLPDPRDHSSMPLLKRVQAGISRIRQQSGTHRQRIRLPITPAILRQIKRQLTSSMNPNRVIIWAIACSAFFGFFRLGELLPESAKAFSTTTGLTWGDVALDRHQAPSMVQFHLKKSKTDQLGKGVDVVVGATGDDLCPVKAITSFVEARGSNPGPFFQDPEGTIATKPWFINELRGLLTQAGLPQSDFAGHSFRIGAATTAALAGIEDSAIQVLGRWRSSAFLGYVRTPKERLATLSASLSKPSQASQR